MGISVDDAAHKDTVDPEAWAIVDGKLYLVHNQYWLQVWQEKAEEHIKQANKDWDVVKNLPGPEIIGPPCAASPPTTKVALRDGGHLIVVGGQVARDKAGNIVGKGDLGAQIEQVGKNVGACLEAGGATVKDIVFTVSYVKQPAEFDKYADLRQRYFGPPSPQSTIVAMPQSTGPDFLVQVEAFAKTPVTKGPWSRTALGAQVDKLGLNRYIIAISYSPSAVPRGFCRHFEIPLPFFPFQGILASRYSLSRRH